MRGARGGKSGIRVSDIGVAKSYPRVANVGRRSSTTSLLPTFFISSFQHTFLKDYRDHKTAISSLTCSIKSIEQLSVHQEFEMPSSLPWLKLQIAEECN